MALEGIGIGPSGGGGAGAAVGGYGLLASLIGANMNSTADQPFGPRQFGFIVRRIVVTNASISLTTAAGGIYTGAAKGGTAIVAAIQTYATLTSPTVSLDLTIAAAAVNTVLSASPSLFLSLTTAQGAAATADFYFYGERLA